MGTLIWKEIREYRLQFLVLVMFGLATVSLVWWFNNFDKDLIVLGLFAICAPLFSFFFTMNLVSRERAANTLPFLLALPLPRKRLWESKLVAAFLFSLALYLTYSAICRIPGVTILDHQFSPHIALTVSDGFILGCLPFMLISLGMFLTMVPAEIKTAVIALNLLGGYGLFLGKAIPTINYGLAVPLYCATWLLASRYAFIHAEMFETFKTSMRSLGILMIFVVAASGIWVGLDALAQKTFDPVHCSIHDIQYDRNIGRLMVQVRHPSPIWAPISRDEQSRVIAISPITGQIDRVYPHETEWVDHTPNGALEISRSTALGYGFVGPEVLRLQNLQNPEYGTECIEDVTGFDYAINDSVVLTTATSDGTTLTSFVKHFVPGSGIKAIFSDTARIRGCPAVFAGKQVLINSTRGACLVSLENGQKQMLHSNGPAGENPRLFMNNTENASPAWDFWPVIDGPDSVLAMIGRNSDKPSPGFRFCRINQQGEVTPISWIPSHARIIGKTPNNEILGLVLDRQEIDGPYNRDYRVVLADIQKQTCITIASFTNVPFSVGHMEFDLPRKNVLLSFHPQLGERTWRLLNLATHEVKNVPLSAMKETYYSVGVGEGRFAAMAKSDSIWVYDANSGEERQLFPPKP